MAQTLISMSAARMHPVHSLVAEKIRELEPTLRALERQKDNPTVRDMYHQRLGRLEALRSVLNGFTGNLVDLRNL